MYFGLWFEAEAYNMTLILLWQTVVSHIISFINIFVTYHKLNVYLFYVFLHILVYFMWEIYMCNPMLIL